MKRLRVDAWHAVSLRLMFLTCWTRGCHVADFAEFCLPEM
jgi:hypothetical protein